MDASCLLQNMCACTTIIQRHVNYIYIISRIQSYVHCMERHRTDLESSFILEYLTQKCSLACMHTNEKKNPSKWIASTALCSHRAPFHTHELSLVDAVHAHPTRIVSSLLSANLSRVLPHFSQFFARSFVDTCHQHCNGFKRRFAHTCAEEPGE